MELESHTKNSLNASPFRGIAPRGARLFSSAHVRARHADAEKGQLLRFLRLANPLGYRLHLLLAVRGRAVGYQDNPRTVVCNALRSLYNCLRCFDPVDGEVDGGRGAGNSRCFEIRHRERVNCPQSPEQAQRRC